MVCRRGHTRDFRGAEAQSDREAAAGLIGAQPGQVQAPVVGRVWRSGGVLLSKRRSWNRGWATALSVAGRFELNAFGPYALRL